MLRGKEKEVGIDSLSLMERDILAFIIYLKGKQKYIGLDNILKKCPHPRATFFRCLKKLRQNKFVFVTKNHLDSRRSYISVSEELIN